MGFRSRVSTVANRVKEDLRNFEKLQIFHQQSKSVIILLTV